MTDRILEIARHTLAAPAALFAQVAGAALTIASTGLPDPPSPARAGLTPADLEALVGVALVADLPADPRFADGPWARALPGVRALALAPLRDGAGRCLGVLAVLDTQPRAWTSADARALEGLGAMAAEAIAVRVESERLGRDLGEARRAQWMIQQMVDSLPDGGVVLFDHDLRVVAGGGNVAGLRVAEALGKTLAELRGAEFAASVEPLYRAVLEGRRSSDHVPFGGRVFLVHRMPVTAQGGAIVGGMMAAQDITSQVEAEEALRESEARYRAVFEHVGDAIIIAAIEGPHAGTLRDFNDAAVRLHGYTRDEMLGMKFGEFVPPEQREGAAARIQRMLAGEWMRHTTVQRQRDGALIPVDVSAGAIDLGGLRHIVAIVKDATERTRVEGALREAKRAAEAASVAKSAFLASMSHEIRTPMNAVLGYAQLLQRDPAIGAEQQRHLAVIRRSGEHLLELVNDVLEMSKVEAGHRALHLGALDLGAVLDDVERMFRLRTEAKQISFSVRAGPGVPRHLVGDEGRIRQVLVNLVGNAVKFTERGRVDVRASAPMDEAGGRQLVIEVEDTGPGIDAAALADLFQPFVQARAGIRAQGGTGLGLAISREYARMMGGDITVTSWVGTGSVFCLAIPLRVGSAGPVARADAEGRVVGIAGPDAPPRVLVADDNADNRGWLTALLRQIGFDVQEAANGAEAVASFEAWRPRLVLIDMNMPVMDGYAAMPAIRALSACQPVTLLAVTASAFDQERDAILAAGADAVLRKPCREADLLEMMREHLGLSYVLEEPRGPAAGQATPGGERPAAMPEALAAALREAARVADYGRLMALLDEVPARSAAALRAAVERYDYEGMERLLG